MQPLALQWYVSKAALPPDTSSHRDVGLAWSSGARSKPAILIGRRRWQQELCWDHSEVQQEVFVFESSSLLRGRTSTR